MCDISFITLTWNSEAYIGRCLESIAGRCTSEGLDFEIIAVDNGSTDRTISVVRSVYTRIGGRLSLVPLDRNRGTTYPRNLALKQAVSRTICVIDSDTEFRSGSLGPVIRLLESDSTLGIVAPRLLLPDGSVQHSVKRFPTLMDKLRKVPHIVMGRPAPRPDFYAPFPFDGCTYVETAISACWLLRRDVLQSVGLLDEGIFYAPEDVEYSARIRESGLRILYCPALTLLHHTQQISHRRPFSAVSLSHLHGLLRYHRKHGGWFVKPAGGPVPAPEADAALRQWAQEPTGARLAGPGRADDRRRMAQA